MTAANAEIGAIRGTALFVAAIIGPGILTLPALAAAQAGPASLFPLALLLAISAPIAFTFVALHAATPDAPGIPGYATAAFGPVAGRLVSAWFSYGVPIGVPALGLIGGQYVAEAFGGGEPAALVAAASICALAIAANILQRAASGALTLLLTAALVVLITSTAVVSIPHADIQNLTPVAPNGFLAVAASALVLTWILTGWEAVTNFSGILRNPGQTLPRVTAVTLVVVAVLYAAMALAEILVLGPTVGGSEAPVAEILRVAVGPTGAIVAAVFAMTIALGNSLAYVGSLAELGLAQQPPNSRQGPRAARTRALTIPTAIIAAGLAAVAFTPIGTKELISICAGSQVPVYVLGLAAGVKLLPRRTARWWLAVFSTVAVAVLLIPAGIYLLVPGGIALSVLIATFGARRPDRSTRVCAVKGSV
jgi:amino acid efflux transporter